MFVLPDRGGERLPRWLYARTCDYDRLGDLESGAAKSAPLKGADSCTVVPGVFRLGRDGGGAPDYGGPVALSSEGSSGGRDDRQPL